MTSDDTADGDLDPDDDQTAAGDRRLFGDRRETLTVFVGAALGLTRVEVATDRVGQFSLVERTTVTGVATAPAGTTGEAVVVGTGETVLVGDGEQFEPVGFGPAVTVGVDDNFAYAADHDGAVARFPLSALADGTDGAGDRWESVGTVDGPARFCGPYLAAADGLYRVGESLEHLGLSGVHDVTAGGEYAATADGIHRGNGAWASERDGDARAVIARGGAAHAIADDGLVVRRDGTWETVDVPTDEPLVDLAYGHGVYVLTAEGTLVVEGDPDATSDGHAGWRARALGVGDARGLAVANRKDV